MDIDDVEQYATHCRYPVVVKARKGAGADEVWYAANPEELVHAYTYAMARGACCDGVIRDTRSPIFQEYVPGDLHDVAAFCLKGEMVAGLTQKRLLTRPRCGGKGICNVTTHNEELLDYAGRLVSDRQWNGVLLMDFKMDDREAKPKLLEVNPRFWGTTWLTTCAGLNFPHNWVLAAKEKPLQFPDHYQVGLTCRWPLYEVGSLLERPRSFQSVLMRFKQILSCFRREDCTSDAMWSDWKPLVAEFIRLGVIMWRALIRDNLNRDQLPRRRWQKSQ
jgi:predicted ATP-grasp superfamily ATP-dependent carboligase